MSKRTPPNVCIYAAWHEPLEVAGLTNEEVDFVADFCLHSSFAVSLPYKNTIQIYIIGLRESDKVELKIVDRFFPFRAKNYQFARELRERV